MRRPRQVAAEPVAAASATAAPNPAVSDCMHHKGNQSREGRKAMESKTATSCSFINERNSFLPFNVGTLKPLCNEASLLSFAALVAASEQLLLLCPVKTAIPLWPVGAKEQGRGEGGMWWDLLLMSSLMRT